MKHISLDIETLGLDAENDSIIQISAIFDDLNDQKSFDSLPKLDIFVDDGFIHGNTYALNMHIKSGLWKEWSESKNKLTSKDAIQKLLQFSKELFTEEKIVYSGVNLGAFDIQFLKRNQDFKAALNTGKISHRYLNPTDLFIDYKKDSLKPGLEECKQRAGISGEVTHRAIEDAMDVIKLIRYITNNKNG